MNNPQQPREYDAVLGGNSPSLEGAAVLGGIEGVKWRLKNPDAKVRIAALEQAVNYGEQGLDLVIAALNDESLEIQDAAYFLLKSRKESIVKQALIDSEAYLIKQVGLDDYTKLRDLLSLGKWKEADVETGRIMWDVLYPNSFPVEDLYIVDKLWVKYSNGRFGFSIQNQFYQRLTKQISSNWRGLYVNDKINKEKLEKEIWTAFCWLQGWKRVSSSNIDDKLYDRLFDEWMEVFSRWNQKGEWYRSHQSEFDNYEIGCGIPDNIEEIKQPFLPYQCFRHQYFDKLSTLHEGFFSCVETCQTISISPVLMEMPEVPPKYRKLRKLLAFCNWRSADQETRQIMLGLVKSEKQDWLGTKKQNDYLSRQDIENLPCEDIYIIDKLWLKYSHGRFGFSVQKAIYQNLKVKEYNKKIQEAFAEQVGWMSREKKNWWQKEGICLWKGYFDLTFDNTAPNGHLPTLSRFSDVSSEYQIHLFISLFSRMTICNL